MSLRARAEADGRRFVAISSATGAGIKELINTVAGRLDDPELPAVGMDEVVEIG